MGGERKEETCKANTVSRMKEFNWRSIGCLLCIFCGALGVYLGYVVLNMIAKYLF